MSGGEYDGNINQKELSLERDRFPSALPETSTFLDAFKDVNMPAVILLNAKIPDLYWILFVLDKNNIEYRLVTGLEAMPIIENRW
jgi:hypothetical protein